MRVRVRVGKGGGNVLRETCAGRWPETPAGDFGTLWRGGKMLAVDVESSVGGRRGGEVRLSKQYCCPSLEVCRFYSTRNGIMITFCCKTGYLQSREKPPHGL